MRIMTGSFHGSRAGKIPVNPHVLEIYGISLFVFVRQLDIIDSFQLSDERVEIKGTGIATYGCDEVPGRIGPFNPADS
jgi:hypothetical protein